MGEFEVYFVVVTALKAVVGLLVSTVVFAACAVLLAPCDKQDVE